MSNCDKILVRDMVTSMTNVLGKALFIRLDRIGDLVLSLPVDRAFPDSQVDWWIPRGLSFVTDHSVPKRNAKEMARTITFGEFVTLVRTLRRENYQTAVVFQAPWWVSVALFLAGIPNRIGVRSKIWSFLFYNRGVRQKRSQSDRNELEYNFQLLEAGLGKPQGSLPRATLKLQAPFPALSVSPLGLQPQNYFVVHPGMGGSALNWPTARYVELIRILARRGPVAITGTAADESYLSPLKVNLAGESAVVWLDGKLSGRELIGLLAHAQAVVAPSTGVLHLAASTGQPTVGLFSQVRVQKATRWGPQGARTAVAEAPDESADAMNKISAEDVLEKISQA